MARGQSQRLSASVFSELTSSSGEFTIQQEESESRNPAMDEQVRMSLTPQQKEFRTQFRMAGLGYYEKKAFKSEIDSEIAKQEARTATPKLNINRYLNETNGSLKDILAIGDSLAILTDSRTKDGKGKIGEQKAYRVIGVKDKELDIAVIDTNGNISDNKTIVYKNRSNYQPFDKKDDAYPLNVSFGVIKNFRRNYQEIGKANDETRRLMREGKIKPAGKGFDTGE